MILEKIYLEDIGNEVYFKADLHINEKKETLWYKTDLINKDYISLNNGDSFILILFVYAVFNNLKFDCKVPVSKELNYGLLKVLLPAFKKMGFNSIEADFSLNIIDEKINEKAQANACAMSFGVDSFHTYFENENSVNKIDIFTLFNAGAFGNIGGELTRNLFNLMKDKLNKFSNEMNKEFIWVDTNINEFINIKFTQTHTFRNFSCALLFQNHIRNYFYASGYPLNEFKLDPISPAYYDLLNSKAIKSNNMDFHISGITDNRIDKTIFISDKEVIYKNLSVCVVSIENINVDYETTTNCSKCYKCIRTMVTLDVLNQLHFYKNVFDLDLYYKNKNNYIGSLLYKKIKIKDTFAIDVFDLMKKQNFRFSNKVYFNCFKIGCSNLLKKIIK